MATRWAPRCAAGLAAGVPTAALSRGLAGTAGPTPVIDAASFPGACRDAVRLLAGVLPHAVEQRRGGDHPRPAAPADAPVRAPTKAWPSSSPEAPSPDRPG